MYLKVPLLKFNAQRPSHTGRPTKTSLTPHERSRGEMECLDNFRASELYTAVLLLVYSLCFVGHEILHVWILRKWIVMLPLVVHHIPWEGG